jgi:hypothetical protein
MLWTALPADFDRRSTSVGDSASEGGVDRGLFESDRSISMALLFYLEISVYIAPDS